jgi:molybdopterin/thiamine biosynthesis adenylyltransferase
MTAATLIAAEAFKISMRKLREFARTPELFDEQFAACQEIEFVLPTALSPTCQDLGDFDLISGGAISHAVLYCLSRIDNVSGRARVVEPDIADFTNLNRYMLLTVSDVPDPKAERLTQLQLAGLSVTGIESRFDFPPSRELGSLASNVLVGVDDIATRWSVQLTNPAWLGIGATTHWSAMASFHREGLACARCLHPDDDAEQNLIPTAAFVSFFAGLLLAAYFVRHVAGGVEPAREQQTYLTALQSETALTMPVALRQHCPLCGASRRAA